jgi:hypothetical protein
MKIYQLLKFTAKTLTLLSATTTLTTAQKSVNNKNGVISVCKEEADRYVKSASTDPLSSIETRNNFATCLDKNKELFSQIVVQHLSTSRIVLIPETHIKWPEEEETFDIQKKRYDYLVKTLNETVAPHTVTVLMEGYDNKIQGYDKFNGLKVRNIDDQLVRIAGGICGEFHNLPIKNKNSDYEKFRKLYILSLCIQQALKLKMVSINNFKSSKLIDFLKGNPTNKSLMDFLRDKKISQNFMKIIIDVLKNVLESIQKTPGLKMDMSKEIKAALDNIKKMNPTKMNPTKNCQWILKSLRDALMITTIENELDLGKKIVIITGELHTPSIENRLKAELENKNKEL